MAPRPNSLAYIFIFDYGNDARWKTLSILNAILAVLGLFVHIRGAVLKGFFPVFVLDIDIAIKSLFRMDEVLKECQYLGLIFVHRKAGYVVANVLK